MQILPENEHLPVNKLAGCFNNTSATYKFYWFLSIINAIERGMTLISKKELFAGMISSAWYTVNYFHVSFGAQDKLQRAIEKIKVLENITIDADRNFILDQLRQTENIETIQILFYFNTQVPHRFLSPWFPKTDRAGIYHASQNLDNICLYAVYNDFIQINLAWINYLLENAALIKSFCYWNLAMYLQQKNPNVPDIPNKIIKPALRGSLLKQRTSFWDIVMEKEGSLKCIYTGHDLVKGNYAVEHFIPYNFVSHNLIWNLIPADKSFNLSKSDKLPVMDRHFDLFYELQYTAIKIVQTNDPRNKFLEDYLTIFPDLNEIDSWNTGFKERFRERIAPLISIASNNGFEFLS